MPWAIRTAVHVERAALCEGPLDPPVDFSKISSRDFLKICAQCHMQSAIREPHPAGELNYSTHGESFQQYATRPYGEFSRKGFYKDGRFRETTFIVQSLLRSACFRKGNVTCGSCHDPHPADAASKPTSLKFRDHPDQMCLQCYSQDTTQQGLKRHSHHAAASEGSRCVSCHMPRIRALWMRSYLRLELIASMISRTPHQPHASVSTRVPMSACFAIPRGMVLG